VSVLLHAATTEAIEISIPEVKEKNFMGGILQPETPNVKSAEVYFSLNASCDAARWLAGQV
jgi:hypothetical protein